MDSMEIMTETSKENGIVTEEHIYKKTDGHHMTLRVFRNTGNAKPSRGTVMFYFGGGWTGGTMDQFKPQSEYLAGLGLTCITVDYRVASRHGVSPFQCIEDCGDSVKWVMAKGPELGIPTDSIVLSGGSAGGHIAIAGALENLTLLKDQLKGLVLFNPVLDTTETGFAHERFLGRGEEASPIHNLKSDLPKTLIFHGTEDTTVPYDITSRFAEKAVAMGIDCRLIPYEGEDHGFFNDYRNVDHYKSSLEHMERFLDELEMI